MKARYAQICLDCDEIQVVGRDSCGSCTSESLVPLSKWIPELHPPPDNDEIQFLADCHLGNGLEDLERLEAQLALMKDVELIIGGGDRIGD